MPQWRPSVSILRVQLQVDPPEGPSQTEINARNQVELHATTLKYIAMKKYSRPPNTRDTYGPRQKEWGEWCRCKRFADGELVTEAKMVAFLDREVLSRVVRTQPKKGVSPAEEEEGPRPVGLATFSLYSAAIVDLWKEQVSMDLNHHPKPPDEREDLEGDVRGVKTGPAPIETRAVRRPRP